jgi:hypothetical protein
VGDAGEASASQDKRRFGFVETHEAKMEFFDL